MTSADTPSIRVRGARVHNLRSVDADLPHNRLVVVTGPSGSGKSSLAFDTLYAEGQRQYIESLSMYARQFMDQLERPDIDTLEGLPPTICIQQGSANQNPRSTIGTLTEIYDYLRVLLTRLGTPHCHRCGRPIGQQSVDQIGAHVMRLPPGTKAMILAPLVRGRKGAHGEVVEQIRQGGWLRARVDGTIYELDQIPKLSPRAAHTIEAVIDRIVVRDGGEDRIAEAIRLASEQAEGLVVVLYADGTNAGTTSAAWHDLTFSTRNACPDCNLSFTELEPRIFSFNSPYGACPRCEGLGTICQFDPDLVVPDRTRGLDRGAVVAWRDLPPQVLTDIRRDWAPFLQRHGIDWRTPLDRWDPTAWLEFWNGDRESTFVGLHTRLQKEWATATRAARREQLEQLRADGPCPECQGSRLRAEAAHVRLAGLAVQQITALSIDKANVFFHDLSFPEHQQVVAEPLLREIRRRLQFLIHVGVPYLALDRRADSLSGGELQRVRLASSIGSGLVGACYILDEPSIGLHPRDNDRLLQSLRALQQLGNSVIVVEHDEATMRQADYVIDMGPGAGAHGGTIVARGTPAELCQDRQSVTGPYLAGTQRVAPPRPRRTCGQSALVLRGATHHNLKNVDIRIPLGLFVCVTGVSGSGKSSLIQETLAPALRRRLGLPAKPGPFTELQGADQIDKIIEIDQTPIGRNSRSSPATYTGIFPEIRKVFATTKEAKQRGYPSSRFSFNVQAGRCETCQGHGTRRIAMNFLPDLQVPCPQCGGDRFNRATLQIKYRDQSIADVLRMSIDEAADFFTNFPAIARILRALQSVGLGYLPLGRASTTLSGGEAQRIKLATELSRGETGRTLYLLDEPTTGLHFVDIEKLLRVWHQFVDRGNTVIVVEHHIDVIESADWVIDLGPEGGEQGGYIVAEGPPEEIAANPQSTTGRYLLLGRDSHSGTNTILPASPPLC